MLDLEGADDIAAEIREDGLDEIHHALKIAVGLVNLEHGELGIVFPRNTLVAEDAANLEHAVVAADEQAFQAQFKRDAKKEICPERIVVGDERTGGGSAGHAFKHRCLDFQKLPAGQGGADTGDDAAAHHQAGARLGVDDQIKVTLTVNLFGIGQAMPLFGERTQGFADKGEGIDPHGDFASLGFEQRAGDANDVAQIK